MQESECMFFYHSWSKAHTLTHTPGLRKDFRLDGKCVLSAGGQ